MNPRMPGLSLKQQRAAEDARDILDAAELCFVMVIVPEGREGGTVMSNISTPEAVEALQDALTTTTATPPRFDERERRQ